MSYTKRIFTVKSPDGSLTSIECYMPEIPVRAAVQIIYGLSENANDYGTLIKPFTDNGIILYLPQTDIYPQSDGNGKDLDKRFVLSLVSLAQTLRKRYRTVPYFLFGHGLGALICGAAIASNAELCDGAILSGIYTLGAPSYFTARAIKKAVTGGSFDTEKLKSKFFSKASKVLPFGDNSARSDYKTEPAYLHTYTPVMLECISKLLSYVYTPEWANDMPKGIAFLMLGGKSTPFSGYGEGIKQLEQKLIDSDMSDISVNLYNCGHALASSSLFNDITGDIISWILSRADDIALSRRQGF